MSRGAVEIAGCCARFRPGRAARWLSAEAPSSDGCARSGFGFDRSTDRRSAGPSTSPRSAELRQRLVGPLFAALGAELLIPLQRDRIAYTDPSGRVAQIFTTAPVAGSGRLLIGVTFR